MPSSVPYNPHPITDAELPKDDFTDRFKAAVMQAGVSAGSVHMCHLVAMMFDAHARGQGLERNRAYLQENLGKGDDWYRSLPHSSKARVDLMRQQQVEIDSREPTSGR